MDVLFLGGFQGGYPQIIQVMTMTWGLGPLQSPPRVRARPHSSVNGFEPLGLAGLFDNFKFIR